jgi:hypothetical protein
VKNTTSGGYEVLHSAVNKNDQPINLEGVVFPIDDLAIGGDPVMHQRVRNTLQWVDPFQPGSPRLLDPSVPPLGRPTTSPPRCDNGIRLETARRCPHQVARVSVQAALLTGTSRITTRTPAHGTVIYRVAVAN